MLYISTRNNADVSTGHRTLQVSGPSDGGAYIPFLLPSLDEPAMRRMREGTFGTAVSNVLNLLLAPTAEGLGIDFLAEQYFVKVNKLNNRIVAAELWHNLDHDYLAMAKTLCAHVLGNNVERLTPWADIAVRIATVFGVYFELRRQGVLNAGEKFDVSVNTGDFSMPMACWYARAMGLPVGMILCASNENSSAWDFVNRGELNCGLSPVSTGYPELDHAVPGGLERLVFHTLGQVEAVRFGKAVSEGKIYKVGDSAAEVTKGFFSAVVSSGRIASVISSVYRSCGYCLDPLAAFSYAGIQDYRAKSGENRTTVVFAEKSPCIYLRQVCDACGISEEKLRTMIGSR